MLSLTILDLAPLAEGAQHQHRDDAHAPGGENRTGEDPDAERRVAVAGALHVDQPVADESAGQPAEDDGNVGGDPRSA